MAGFFTHRPMLNKPDWMDAVKDGLKFSGNYYSRKESRTALINTHRNCFPKKNVCPPK
jgi:hypothetical protein